jgi:hypothetical protein
VIKDPSARENTFRIAVAKLDENAECAFHELSTLLDDEAGCLDVLSHTTITIRITCKGRATTVRGKTLALRSRMLLMKTGLVAFM